MEDSPGTSEKHEARAMLEAQAARIEQEIEGMQAQALALQEVVEALEGR